MIKSSLRSLKGCQEAIKLYLISAQGYTRKGALGEQTLAEEDYKRLILEHYTFLKRPVIVNQEQVFIGNSKKVVAQAKISIQNNQNT